jgi:hypothetical protein
MFKPKKKSLVPESAGPELPKVYVESELPGGPGTVFLAGTSAAWAQSFKMKSPTALVSPSPVRRSTRYAVDDASASTSEQDEEEDLLVGHCQAMGCWC